MRLLRMQRAAILVVVFAVWLFMSGCQTFRPLNYSPSEMERERDAQVGEVVEVTGNALYWMLPWIP